MDKINILVIADHPEILATILRLIDKTGIWNGVGADNPANAVEVFKSARFELVLLGVGVDEETERQLLQVFKSVNPDVICIRHFGGGSGLLFSEIQHALSTRE